MERCGQVIPKVIHTKNVEKRDKTDLYTKLSTLSTQKQVENVDYYLGKKERVFCGDMIKMVFVWKKCGKSVDFLVVKIH